MMKFRMMMTITNCTWRSYRMQGRQSEATGQKACHVSAQRNTSLFRVWVILTANPPPPSLQWITLLRCGLRGVRREA
jgi:hypothetical protein